MKRSPWHKGSVKPSDIGSPKGVYEREAAAGDLWFNYWDGNFWYWGGSDIETAENNLRNKCNRHQYQNLKWRGILK